MGKLLAALLVCLLCCGCGGGEDPWRVDTVVRIPMDPTDVTRLTEETAPEAAPTEWVRPTFPWTPPEDRATVPVTEPPKTEKPKRREPEKETEPESEPEIAAATEPEAPEYTTARYADGELEAEILRRVNALRQAAGVPELTMDEALSDLAAIRSREAAKAWSHTRPDGRDYATVLTDHGYDGQALAELLAYATAYEDPADAVDIWAGREKGLLRDGCPCVGIGTFRESGYIYICLLLAEK